jgi:tRNA-specific 2-thiouridylase
VDAANGRVLGAHGGQEGFTHGQRARLGGADSAWFVVGKAPGGAVLLAKGASHPLLFCAACAVGGLFWTGEQMPAGLAAGGEMRVQVKTRYAQRAVPATLSLSLGDCAPSALCLPLAADAGELGGGGVLCVRFDEPERAVTPGQALVVYDGEECLGGGTILWPAAAQEGDLLAASS